MAPGEGGRQIEGENVITTGGSLLFVQYNPRGYPGLVASFRPPPATTRRPLNGYTLSPGYFITRVRRPRAARLCG